MCAVSRLGFGLLGTKVSNNSLGYGLTGMTRKTTGPGLIGMFLEEKKKRRVFFSFHYAKDAMRAAQIRNMGIFEGDTACFDNDWESVRNNDDSIKKWISSQMKNRTCCVVLVGSETASRKWVRYEIEEAWKMGLGVVGVYIHNVKIPNETRCAKGANPFDQISYGTKKLSEIVNCYDPYSNLTNGAYQAIHYNIENWIEEAIAIRKRFPK